MLFVIKYQLKKLGFQQVKPQLLDKVKKSNN